MKLWEGGGWRQAAHPAESSRDTGGLTIGNNTVGLGKVPTVFIYFSCSICQLGIGCDISLAMGRTSIHHCCLGR